MNKKIIEQPESINVGKWINKKIKKNKEQFKEKKKENKSWITKKKKKQTKEQKKENKKFLQKYLVAEEMPKAEFYFAAIILPKPNENIDPEYFYGYVNSDKTSETFEFKDSLFYSTSSGYGYSSDGKSTCEIHSKIGVLFNKMKGEVDVSCRNGYEFNGDFTQRRDGGDGSGLTDEGNEVQFKFYSSKTDTIAQYLNYQERKKYNIARGNTEEIDDTNITPTGKYYALLIGNSNYKKFGKWASLKSPINDVTEIAKVLRQQYNFEKVLVETDADRKKIFKAFNQLSKLTTDNDYVLIYYSGHGDIRSNQSYWIPVDAEKEFGMGDWINIKDIEVYLEKEIPAHHLALMVDSCYFPGFKGLNKISEDNKSKVFSKLLDRRARIVLASGNNEPVEDSGQNRHSIFGLSFIQALKNNDDVINLASIGLQIAYAHAGMNQQPYLHNPPTWGHGGGDFIFIKKK